MKGGATLVINKGVINIIIITKVVGQVCGCLVTIVCFINQKYIACCITAHNPIIQKPCLHCIDAKNTKWIKIKNCCLIME